MLARVTTFAIDGIDPRRVTVEVDLRPGLPSFTIVGLADRAVREARERVQSAILNSGFAFPGNRVTVNLAPASLRKAGPHFDLAIAVGILAAAGEVPLEPLVRTAVFGELSLGGEVRPCRGALAVAEGAARGGLRSLLVPMERIDEAALVEEVDVAGVTSLREVARVLRGEDTGATPSSPSGEDEDAEPAAAAEDLADVRGHGDVLAALTVAAAGGHNLLL